MKQKLSLAILSMVLVFTQACSKKDTDTGDANRSAFDAAKFVGSCRTKSSMACTDYVSESGAKTLRPKLKEACEMGDAAGAGVFSETECVEASPRVGRCSMPKNDGPSGVAFSVIVNYYASMQVTSAQVESACAMLKGTYQAN